MESHLHIVRAHWHQRLLHFRGQILPKISKIGVCSCPRDANESHRETEGAKDQKPKRLLLLSVYHVFIGFVLGPQM